MDKIHTVSAPKYDTQLSEP